jgi:hypothetical protein
MIGRTVAVAAGIATVALLASGGTGSAAPAANVAPGQQWTFEVDNGGGCELFDMGTKHSWTDIHFPYDFGTYAGGGNSITIQYGDKALSFQGHYFAGPNEFIGRTNGGSIAQLVEGAVSTWDGVPC